MLADKKKRKKFSINPQGNIWHHDKSKFGQKLLEKMGWKEGQGLGAQNQGISERIKVPFRLNNNAGFGFKEQEDALVQQKEYVTLLSSMNNSNPEQPLDNSNVSSLEDKSKKSRARVHYHKFTRGKDLSRYSSKDLVGIFGKPEIADEVADVVAPTIEEDICPEDQRKKNKKKRKHKELDEAPAEFVETDVKCENLEFEASNSDDEKRLKKKSKKRQKSNDTCNEATSDELPSSNKESDNNEVLMQDDAVNCKKKTKKKKKEKQKLDEPDEVVPAETTETDGNSHLEPELNNPDNDSSQMCDTETKKKSDFSNRESFRYSNKRNMKPDVNGFRGSNLPKIVGYACN